MKNVKRWGSLLLAIIMCFGLCACGASGDGKDAKKSGKIELVWWSSYASTNAEYINEMLSKFNASQDKYHATMLNQGSAAEIRTKLAATKKENLPDMFSGTPITTGYFASGSFIAPLQDFLDQDEDKWYDAIYDVVRTSYADKEGKAIGAPIGVSCAGWFINTDLLKKAGYSVDQMTNFEAIAQAATAIKNKNLAKYGIVFGGNGVDLFDTLTLQGVDILDAGNGYTGEATRCVFNEGETLEVLNKNMKIYGELYKNNVCMTYGSDTNGEKVPQFANGNLGFFYATNSYANKIVGYQPEFEFAFIPSVPVDANGKYAGQAISEGTGNYLCNTGNEEKMQGAYELLKFLCQPENMAYFAANTGYIPYTDEGYNQEVYQTWMQENFPAAGKVKEMLLNSDKNLRGPYTTISNALMTACSTLYSDVALNPNDDYSEFIKAAVDTVDEALEIEALRK